MIKSNKHGVSQLVWRCNETGGLSVLPGSCVPPSALVREANFFRNGCTISTRFANDIALVNRLPGIVKRIRHDKPGVSKIGLFHLNYINNVRRSPGFSKSEYISLKAPETIYFIAAIIKCAGLTNDDGLMSIYKRLLVTEKVDVM